MLARCVASPGLSELLEPRRSIMMSMIIWDWLLARLLGRPVFGAATCLASASCLGDSRFSSSFCYCHYYHNCYFCFCFCFCFYYYYDDDDYY